MIAIAPIATGMVLALAPRASAGDPSEGSASVTYGTEGLPEDFKPEETALPVGWTVPVLGSGWPASGQMLVELCGNGGIGGSEECDLEGQQTIQADPDGKLRTGLQVSAPPAPCPCVIKVTSMSTGDVAMLPLRVRDHPYVQIREGEPFDAPELALSDVTLTEHGAWKRWFGASPRYTLELTVTNVSNRSIHDGTLSITSGKGNDPTGLVEAPQIGVLEPGEAKRLEVPVEFEAMTSGQLTVRGELAAGAVTTPFSVQTSPYPWALILIPIIVVTQAVLLFVRNRLRRRISRREPGELGQEEIDRIDSLVASGILTTADIRVMEAYLRGHLDAQAAEGTVIDLTEVEAEDEVIDVDGATSDEQAGDLR